MSKNQDSTDLLPGKIRLTGGDYFLLALDNKSDTTTRTRLSGNICQLLITLSYPVDPDRLRSVLAQSSFAQWLHGLCFSRPLPFMNPRWLANRHGESIPVKTHRSESSGKNSEKHGNIRFDLFDKESEGTGVLFTWPHALMDARGAEVFIQNLNIVEKDGHDRDGLINLRHCDSLLRRIQSMKTFGSRMNKARRSVHYITNASREPLAAFSPINSLSSGATQSTRIIFFNEDETSHIEEQCYISGANFMKSLFFMAASIKAVKACLSKRNIKEGAIVVPVPKNLRLRGKPGPAFANHISTMTYRVDKDEAISVSHIVSILKEQMMNQMRAGIPEDYELMMNLFRRMPLSQYSKILRGPTKGKIATFFFSDVGESFKGMDTFLSVPVKDVTHFAPVGFPPGLAIVFMRYKGMLRTVISYVKDCFEKMDIDLMESALRQGLLDEGRR